jgi:hypothetical protein
VRKLMLGLVALAAASVLVAPATGAPKGKGLEQFPIMCGGTEVTVTVSSGASFWIGDQHYLLTSFTGTFTALDGSTETETKTYGTRKGLTGTPISCSASFSDPEGTFDVTVTAVPVP